MRLVVRKISHSQNVCAFMDDAGQATPFSFLLPFSKRSTKTEKMLEKQILPFKGIRKASQKVVGCCCSWA